jgi:glutamate synthase (NADPH) small chain
MVLGEPDDRGRRSPIGTGVRHELGCDTVVVALGTSANPVVTRTTPGLALDRRGYVMADATTQATSLPGVFAGGDIVTGGATVILAMGAGRRAAASIVAHLAALDEQAATPLDPDLREATSSCPRCRRPLPAGDDDGICCAGASLAWRCTECAKRSEGFALPHGRCPACGGLLAVLEVPGDAVLGDQELEIVRRAVEIELGGRDFYLAAAVRATDPELRELFASLAAMEREHLDTLVRRYHLEAPPQPTGELGPSLRQAAMPGASGTPGMDDIDDPRTLLDVAITLEQRAEQFFLGHAAGDESSAATRLARELAAEEGEHIAILTTERSALARGRRGLL